MKRKKLLIISFGALIVALLIYVCLFTNLIFNKSCIGITYHNGIQNTGIEILVNYFDDKKQAEKYYNNENIAHYLLGATDDANKWFESLKWPLVSDKRKLCGVLFTDPSMTADELLESWMKEQNLSVCYTSKGLKNQAFGAKKDSSYISSNNLAQTYTDKLDCTDDMKLYYSAVYVYGLGLCESLECYELSVKSKDDYSETFWSIQADQHIESLLKTYLPESKQQDPSLCDIDGTLTYYVGNIKSCFNEAKQNGKSSSDLSEMISSFKLWITTEIK